MKKRLMAMCVLAAVMLAGCGSVEKADTSEEKSDKKSASQEKETEDKQDSQGSHGNIDASGDADRDPDQHRPQK